MSASQFSSGDLVADRRADYARLLAEGGEHAAAAELMEQALELVPDWAAGWLRLSEHREKAGDRDGTIAALRRLAALDRQEIFAARLKLAVLGVEETPAQPPSRYVEALFDEYAARFDTALVEKLDYNVPETLAALIASSAPDRGFSCAVDLGCGTGLLGVEIRDRAEWLEGFDLSANMLAKAGEKGVYDHLARADLSLPAEASGLFAGERPDHRADLVTAADVLMYLGDLEAVFAIIARLLAPRGLVAFSVEDAGPVPGYELRPSLRYAHSENHVRGLVSRHGLDVLQVVRQTIRRDGGEPISGILFIAAKPA